MAHKVRLYKITSTHQNVRTDIIDGVAPSLPEPGQSFCLWGKGLEFGTRMVATTPVLDTATIDGEIILFKTKNSTYTLLIEGKIEEDTIQ